MAEALPNFWQRLLYTRMRDVLRGQIDGSLDWRVAVARAELPDAIADTITQVVRRTRLYRNERVAVAEELISHFQEGIDAGRSAGELIDAFGDGRLVARLIRRSKIRCRSLVWHASNWIRRALAIGAAMYLLTAFWCWFDHPWIATDYFAAINQPNALVAESDRAWPLYAKAFRTLVAANDPPEAIREYADNPVQRAMPEYFGSYDDFNDAERRAADSWLEKNSEYLELLRTAAARPHLGLDVGVAGDYSAEFRAMFEIDESTPDALVEPLANRMLQDIALPHIQAMREGAAALSADMERSAAAGDGETALADFRAVLGIADHFDQSPFLVPALVEFASVQYAIRSLETVVEHHPGLWDDEQLQAAAHLLASHEFDLIAAMHGERLAFLDLVQRLYTDDGHGDGRLTAKGIQMLERWAHELNPATQDDELSSSLQRPLGQCLLVLGMPTVNTVVASRSEIVAKNDELWRVAEMAANRPLWESSDIDPFDQLNEELISGRFEYAPLALMFPAIGVARLSLERIEALREGVLVGLALELYHRENDRWPESLTDLAPRYVPALPVDRLNGVQLGYRVVDDRPVVYSLGIDGDDDFGTLPTKCDGDKSSYYFQWPRRPTSEVVDGDWVLWGTPVARERDDVISDQ